MGDKTESVDKANIATPIGQDLVDILRGQLAESGLGLPATGLQREAGTAIRQFLNSGGIPPALMKRLGVETDRSAGDLRESFGIAGSRFGTPLAFGESLLRSDALGRAASIGSQNTLQAIMGMNQIGAQGVLPFLQLAQLGILDPDTVVKKGFASHLTDTIGALGGAAKGAASLGLGFGSNG